MPRLIEVDDAGACPSPLTLQPGDVLLFRAVGGVVRSGGTCVELLGPFTQAVVAEDGSVLSPVGPPNAVLFRARRPGRAGIEVVTGDPFYSPQMTPIDITVQS